MKRHPGLRPLSRHHHFALVQALELCRAAEARGAERTEKLRTAAQTYLRFWQQEGKIHFREEEEILLPAYAREVPLENDADVLHMLAQHAKIRSLGAEIKSALIAGNDLQAIAAELGKLLHRHVRLEEDVIFPHLEEVLGEEILQETGARLTELHAPRSRSAKPES